MKEKKKEILPGPDVYIPHIAYDSVIFGFADEQLMILILEYHNTKLYALPGGFVKHNEDLDDAVQKGLRERTGLDNVHLEQFHTFGNLERYVPEVMENILKARGLEVSKDYWMLKRFFSVAYYSLINFKLVTPRPDVLADSIQWYPISELPHLMLDHNIIVNKALETLRSNLDNKITGAELLPEKFTMKELQTIYEVILGEKLRRSSFQRKILSKDILIRHEKQFTGKAHKAPYLYSFRES